MRQRLDPEDAGIDSDENFRRRANAAANKAAQFGALSHPRASLNEHAGLDKVFEMSRTACRLAAKLLPLWPRLHLDGVSFVGPESEVKPAAFAGPGRDWHWHNIFFALLGVSSWVQGPRSPARRCLS